MIPQASDVYAKARKALGDNEVAGGDLYTDAFLLTHLQTAVNIMFRALSFAESPALYRKGFVYLPARQRYLDLSTNDLGDLASMRSIRSRTVGASAAITGLAWNSGTAAWRVTSVAHGRATNDTVYMVGVTEGPDAFINTDWPIVVIDADTFDLLGSPNKTASTSTWSAGGSWYFPTDSDWSFPYDETAGIQDTQDSYSSGRRMYDLREGALRIEGSEQDRLLEVNYRMSPDNIVSTAPNLRIPNSLDALSYLTAALAAAETGSRDASADCLLKAVGPTYDQASGRNPGGFLGDLVQQHATMSRQPVHTRRARPQRRFRRRTF